MLNPSTRFFTEIKKDSSVLLAKHASLSYCIPLILLATSGQPIYEIDSIGYAAPLVRSTK